MESMRIKMKLYRKRRNLVISVIFPDLHALPPDLHHEMLGKLLQGSFVMIVVKHIFIVHHFFFYGHFCPRFPGHHHDQGGEEMPVLIRTIPSFPGYFSAGQSITVLRRIRGRYGFFYTRHNFASWLLSWDLLLHGKFNKNNFFPSYIKWHTLAHIWNPAVKENPESSKYCWQLSRFMGKD